MLFPFQTDAGKTEKLNKTGSMYRMLSLGRFCLYLFLPHVVMFVIDVNPTAADERKNETHKRIDNNEKIRPGASVQLPVFLLVQPLIILGFRDFIMNRL